MSWSQLNIKKLLFSLFWVAIGVGTVGLLVAASRGREVEHCRGIEINISGVSNNFFIDKNDVLAIINRYTGREATKKTVESFNLQKIEEELEKDVWIKDAELYFDNNNILRADVEEREPIARVFTQSGKTFYIDSSVMMLPLSDKFSARLPVFTGFGSDASVLSRADSLLLRDIRNLGLALVADNFLMGMIDQVDITPQRTFEMIPKIGRQLIIFGDASDLDEKFRKLKIFYKEVMMKAGWNKYSSINLQYKDQVVAKLRGREDIAADSLRTIQLMQLMASEAAKHSADSMQLFSPDSEKNTADTSLIQQSIQRDEIAEPSISNTFEKPTPQEPTVPSVVKPASAVVPKPVPAKPLSKQTTAVKPATVKSSAGKPVIKKPIVKKTTMVKSATKPVQQKPKAVMTGNEY